MILAAWLTRRLLVNFAVFALGLSVLLGLFDVLARSVAITAGSESAGLAHLFYALFRFPEIFTFVFPFAFLLAALATFRGLAEGGESMVLAASGWSLPRLCLLFMLVSGCLGMGVFWVSDQVVTAASERLERWAESGYVGLPRFEEAPEEARWIAADNYLIRPEQVLDRGRHLLAPTFIELGQDGKMVRYLQAREARWQAGAWVLQDVELRSLSEGRQLRTERVVIELPLRSVHFSELAEPLTAVAFNDLWEFGYQRVSTQMYPSLNYRVEAWQRISWPLGAMVLVLFAAPMAAQLPRIGHPVLYLTIALLAGFAFFFVTRFSETAGLQVLLPPWLAGLAAHLAFATVGVLLVFFARK